MGECGYCERSVYIGHAPDCIHRCKSLDENGVQCDLSPNHGSLHGVYGPDVSDPIVREWE
jgi:hypothetical protein